MSQQQCFGRYTNKKNCFQFPSQSAYFHELRCPSIEILSKDGLCEKCEDKIKKEKLGTRMLEETRFQGFIYEPLSPSSWIFDSERFWKFANRPGNMPPKDALDRAITAQRIARNNVEMKNTVIIPATKPTEKEPQPETEKKVTKRKYTKKSTESVKKEDSTPISTPSPAPQIIPKKEENQPEKITKKKVKKIASSTVQPLAPVKPATAIATAIQSNDTPIEPEEILKVVLKNIEINDTFYWIDSKKDKLYKKESNGSIGNYIGRFDRDAVTIDRNFPDSDVE